MDSVPAANDQFTELMAGVRNGSPEAINQLVKVYAPPIHRAIRRHLNARLRKLYDTSDFSQAAWASFFRQLRNSPEFNTPPQLVAVSLHNS